jgi:hypothetical protein
MAPRLQKYIFVNFNKSHYFMQLKNIFFFFEKGAVGFARFWKGSAAQ